MAVKPSSPASDLADLVTCPICLENFQDARALPCLHSYCKKCLHGLLTPQGKITCPHCRMEHEIPDGDVSNLKSNFYVKNVLDVLHSGPYESLAGNEVATGDAAAGNAGATAAKISEKVNATCCKDHPEKECELFCQSCSKLICYKCVSNWGTCGQHSYESIETVVKEYRIKVEEYLCKKQELLPSVIKHIGVLAEMKGKQSDNVSDVTKDISDTFAKHVESLKIREEALIQQALDMQWGNADSLTHELDKANLELAKTENIIQFCHNILDLQDPVLFLKTYSDLKDKVSETNSQDLVSHVDIKALHFQTTDLLLSDVISNFGNVVYEDVCAADEKPPEKDYPLKGLPTSERPGNDPRSLNQAGPSGKPVLASRHPPAQPVVQPMHAEPETTAKPGTWKLCSKYFPSSGITFENNGCSVKTKSSKNAAIIAKPGFRKGKHSWQIKVTGCLGGLGIGICVGENGPGILVTCDSNLTSVCKTVNVQVKLDCEARKVSVHYQLPAGYQADSEIGFNNPLNFQMHPYFNLPPPVQHLEPNNYNKMTITNIDGVPLEQDEPCCIL